MEDPLNEALGLPAPEPAPKREMILPGDGDEYRFVRENLSEMVIKGPEALDELKQIAVISQHPGAYRAYGELMSSVVNATKEIMAAKKLQASISGEASGGPTTINNTLIMTPDEVLKALKERSRG